MRLLRLAILTVAVAVMFPLNTLVASAATWEPPALKVAVVKSQPTIDWVAKYRPGGYPHSDKWDHSYRYLQSIADENGWTVTSIGDGDLRSLDKLNQYDVVVLPYVMCMDSTPNVTLRKYVAGGGGLVSLMASPRIAPGWKMPVMNPIERWKWGRVLGSTAWSWGPLSEASQVRLIDDNYVTNFKVSPVTLHPITALAGDALESRGFDGSPGAMKLARTGTKGGFEMVKRYSGNPNAVPFMTMYPNDATVNKRYGVSFPGGIASEYYDGRIAQFMWQPVDFFENFSTDRYRYKYSSGNPQGEVAQAFVEAAIVWAATDDGKRASVNRDARTWAYVDVYEKSIYAHQYITNKGNVPTSGTLKWRVFDPSGKCVDSWTRYYTPSVPGTTQRFSQSYNPGRYLSSGVYKVVVQYQFTYPTFSQSWTEQVSVRRKAGADIRTKRLY